MENSSFHIELDVRVGDLNYGNHVGHQHYFLYFQEARMAYLKQLGYSEIDIEGLTMVVAEAGCRYKHELLHGDRIRVHCNIAKVKPKAFIFEYTIIHDRMLCATGTTTSLCLEPGGKKVALLPEAFVQAVNDFEARQ